MGRCESYIVGGHFTSLRGAGRKAGAETEQKLEQKLEQKQEEGSETDRWGRCEEATPCYGVLGYFYLIPFPEGVDLSAV